MIFVCCLLWLIILCVLPVKIADRKQRTTDMSRHWHMARAWFIGAWQKRNCPPYGGGWLGGQDGNGEGRFGLLFFCVFLLTKYSGHVKLIVQKLCTGDLLGRAGSPFLISGNFLRRKSRSLSNSLSSKSTGRRRLSTRNLPFLWQKDAIC